MGVINKLLGRLKLYSDPAVTTQTTTVIQSDTTNSSIALVPNGTGAIIARVPDGTATGGNARGVNAVDLQQVRYNQQFVASGAESVIAGGVHSTASGTRSSILGGEENRALSSWSSVGGGFGNTASSNFSTISGGQSNTASTNTHATVVGGQSNTSSGNGSTSGGVSNTASGQYSISIGNLNLANANQSIAFGYNNKSTGIGAFSVGNNNWSYQAGCNTFGHNNESNISYGTAAGFYAMSHFYGEFTYASGRFANAGDAQQSLLTARNSAALTTGATLVLSLDGTGTTNLIIPNGNNRAWKVKVEWISTVTTITGTATGITVGDMAYGEANFGFKKVSGTSVLGNFINDEEASDSAIMDTCSLGYSVGASQELALTFTGPTFSGGGSVTMRVVAKVSLVEVAY